MPSLFSGRRQVNTDIGPRSFVTPYRFWGVIEDTLSRTAGHQSLLVLPIRFLRHSNTPMRSRKKATTPATIVKHQQQLSPVSSSVFPSNSDPVLLSSYCSDPVLTSRPSLLLERKFRGH